MTQHSALTTKKYRLTAFIDPVLVKRAKIRGALEGLTISEVVEKALEAYVPTLEKDGNQHIRLKFINGLSIDAVIPETDRPIKRIVSKHTKNLVVPR